MPRVVVIDSSPDIRVSLTTHLAKLGVQVLAAATLDEGYALIQSLRPQIVVLSVEMPERSGVAFLSQLRTEPASAKMAVLMMTSVPVREVLVQVAQLGVRGLVLKDEKLATEISSRVSGLLHNMSTAHRMPLHAIPQSGSSSAVQTSFRTLDEAVRATLANAPSVPARSATPVPASTSISAPTPPATPAPAPRPTSRLPVIPGNTLLTDEGLVGYEGETLAQDDQDDLAALNNSLRHLDGSGFNIEEATEELKRLKPLMTRTELFDKVINLSELKALRPAVQQVLSLTNNANASIEAIGRAIRQDQALSLKMLKIVNSPLYNRGERVETVHKAVAILGVSQIRQTVMNLSVMDQFGSVNLAERIRADWFWEHSLGVGLVASKLARIQGLSPDQSEMYFTAGLLHDIGRLIFAEQLQDTYAGVIDVAATLQLPLEIVESRMLLINHADLTDRLLRQWNFSPELVNPISLHHISVGNARRTVPKMAQSVLTIGLANILTHAMLLGSSGNDSLYAFEEHANFLNISADQIEQIVSSIPDELCDLKLAMLSHSQSVGTQYMQELTKSLLVPVRPKFLGLSPAMDPVAIMLSRFQSQGSDGPPNIAIMRICDAREKAVLMSQLKEAKLPEDVPLLVVGAGPNCFFPEGTFRGRPVTQITLPIRLERLISIFNDVIGEAAKRMAA